MKKLAATAQKIAKVVIGLETSECILLTISVAYEERLKCEVSGKTGGFSFAYDCDMMLRDFFKLHAGLKTLYETLSGEALLSCLEGQVTIRLIGNGRGRIAVSGQLSDQLGSPSNHLNFEFEMDQTMLPTLIGQLDFIMH